MDLGGSLPVILSIILMEGLLSVDNALVLASIVSHLPEKEQKLALRLGFIGAYVLRILALLAASFLMRNTTVKIFAALFLIHLMIRRIGLAHKKELQSREEASLWKTVLRLQFVGLLFSIDNIVAAVAFSNNFAAIALGVAIGMLIMRLVAGYCVTLMKRWPFLKMISFVLLGYVGVQLIVDEIRGSETPPLTKFSCVVGILAIGFAYSRLPAMKRILSPTAHFAEKIFGQICRLENKIPGIG